MRLAQIEAALVKPLAGLLNGVVLNLEADALHLCAAVFDAIDEINARAALIVASAEAVKLVRISNARSVFAGIRTGFGAFVILLLKNAIGP